MSGRWVCRRAIFFLFLFLASAADEDDVRCLRGLKTSIGDPDGLVTWDFSNTTVGFVCNFIGITCWNPQENRVISVSLPSMSLTGVIPSDLQFCHGANTLDLSGNSFSGSIPPSLCDWLPFLVTLDLSGNSLSGPIPPELSNCPFLNTLDLSSNSLSGLIPASLSRLNRLKRLDLSDNRLTGAIPQSLASSFPSSSVFQSNPGLCGHPVSSRCGSSSISRTALITIIAAAAIFGAVASLLIAYVFWRLRFSSDNKTRRSHDDGDGGQWWAKRLRASYCRLVPVSLFQKPIVKLKLSDLMSATADFHPDHIIAAGSLRAGTSYKAVLSDGSALTVKRLEGCALSEKQFRAEMGRIGQIRHPNLVPLLGFCVVEEDHLLIYKHMPNGALPSYLYASAPSLAWLNRLAIAIGAARGLAWLHHGFQTPLLHQSISSSAVLLDEDCEARVTDFGLHRLANASRNADFVDFGYVPPEFASSPVATTKVDVFAFGVVLLELSTGQKPTEVSSGEGFKGNLVNWVNQMSEAGRMLDCLDTSICGKGDDEEILEFLRIARSCVASRPKERPSMRFVYQSLKAIGDRHDFSEQFDEFPLAYGKDDPVEVL